MNQMINQAHMRVIQNTISSLLTSSVIQFSTPSHWLGVVVRGRTSPYVSHRQIEYVEVTSRFDLKCLVVSNDKAAAAISAAKEAEFILGQIKWHEDLEATDRPSWAEFWPDYSVYKTEWVGGLIPSIMVEGIIQDAKEFLTFDPVPELGAGSLAGVYVLTPQVASFFVEGDRGWPVPLLRRSLGQAAELIGSQGALKVYKVPNNDPMLESLPIKAVGPYANGKVFRVLNHTVTPVGCNRCHFRAPENPVPLAPRPLGEWDGEWIWALRVMCGQLVINSPDHETVVVEINEPGPIFLTHPIPRWDTVD